MKVNPSVEFHNTNQQIQKMNQDHEKAQEVFEKMLAKEMLKGMMKTTTFEEKDSSIEKDFQEEMMIDILSDRMVEARFFQSPNYKDSMSSW